MTQTDERRPLGAPNGPGEDNTTVPAIVAGASEFLAGYDCGVAVVELEAEARGWRAGYAAGRADEAAERDAADAAAAEVAHRRHAAFLASLTPYDELAERRGMPEAAARQRAILAANGVTL